MRMRSQELSNFMDAAAQAFTARATEEQSQRVVAECFERLDRPRDTRAGGGARLPVCERHLDGATDPRRFQEPDLASLVDAFRSIEPMLTWQQRADGGPEASDNFAQGHANAMIAGPGGFEPRTDVWLGVSLLAPYVRYPDHHHAPEEVYLVMSPGEFSQGAGPWFQPGVGGSFYNPPNILHAMQSGPTSLFAFWLLRPTETPERVRPI